MPQEACIGGAAIYVSPCKGKGVAYGMQPLHLTVHKSYFLRPVIKCIKSTIEPL